MYKKLVIFAVMMALGGGLAFWDIIRPPTRQLMTLSEEADEFSSFSEPDFSIAPDFTAPDLDGRRHNLSDYKDSRTILLHFWASWCAPCLEEFPDLLAYAAGNRDRALTLLAVSVDKTSADIERFLRRLPLESQKDAQASNVVFLHDQTRQIAQALYQSRIYPETYILRPGSFVSGGGEDRPDVFYMIRKISGANDWSNNSEDLGSQFRH